MKCTNLKEVIIYAMNANYGINTFGEYSLESNHSNHLTIYGYKGSTFEYCGSYNFITYVPIDTYTVTFKDYDGTVLKTESVNYSKSATAPSNPTREGYTFTGWDKEFTNITENLTVMAQYEEKAEEKPTEIRPNIDIILYLFDAKYYADKYSDIKEAFGYNEELLKNHYMTYGIKEGRQASPIFDPQYYINAYGDLKQAYGNNYELAYNHFVNYGYKEGRTASQGTNVVKYIKNVPIDITNYMFDVELYYLLYVDLQQVFGYNPVLLKQHYLTYGIKEGRQASPIFDPQYYINAYGDLKQAYGNNYEQAYNHFIKYGINEGRQASKLFNVSYYLKNNLDLSNEYETNYSKALEHFINYGINEGRTASNQFVVSVYKASNVDLSRAFNNSWKQYFSHYIIYGQNENRKCV